MALIILMQIISIYIGIKLAIKLYQTRKLFKHPYQYECVKLTISMVITLGTKVRFIGDCLMMNLSCTEDSDYEIPIHNTSSHEITRWIYDRNNQMAGCGGTGSMKKYYIDSPPINIPHSINESFEQSEFCKLIDMINSAMNDIKKKENQIKKKRKKQVADVLEIEPGLMKFDVNIVFITFSCIEIPSDIENGSIICKIFGFDRGDGTPYREYYSYVNGRLNPLPLRVEYIITSTGIYSEYYSGFQDVLKSKQLTRYEFKLFGKTFRLRG